MSDIKDILGLGKVLPLEKLIDVVQKAVGRLSKSYFDRKDIDTEVYRIKKLSEAKAEEMKVIARAFGEVDPSSGNMKYEKEGVVITSSTEKGGQLTLKERADSRIEFQGAKKQLNIERVVSYAANHLKDLDAITEEPVDNDWISRFFTVVEDISGEDMQVLWGKILAGEIESPGSYSLRTLDVFKNMTESEAKCFANFGKYSISNDKLQPFMLVECIPYSGSDNHEYDVFRENEFGISLFDTYWMLEVGLLNWDRCLTFKFLHEETLNYGGKQFKIVLNNFDREPLFEYTVCPFSRIGSELLKLIEPSFSEDYINLFGTDSVAVIKGKASLKLIN